MWELNLSCCDCLGLLINFLLDVCCYFLGFCDFDVLKLLFGLFCGWKYVVYCCLL